MRATVPKRIVRKSYAKHKCVHVHTRTSIYMNVYIHLYYVICLCFVCVSEFCLDYGTGMAHVRYKKGRRHRPVNQ